MLTPKNLSPDDCVYYNAAYVLQVFLRSPHEGHALSRLYCETQLLRPMSYPLFLLCLDWLYLIGRVEMTDEKIVLCI